MKIYNAFIITIVCCLVASSPLIGQSPDQFQQRLKPKASSDALPRNKWTNVQQSAHFVPSPPHRNCATMEMDSLLRNLYPELGSLHEFEQALQAKMDALSHTIELRDPENSIVTIPVIIHIVHNGEPLGVGANISYAQALSQLEVLNEDFSRSGAGANNYPFSADTEIRFAPALVDPLGQVLPEPGIRRINGNRPSWTRNEIQSILKPNTSWDPLRYFNFWTVQFGSTDQSLLGYAQFPSLSALPGLDQNEGPGSTDGVVIRWQAFGRTGNVQAPFNRGRTATHEVGHWLGLRHIWGDGGCNVDDFCSDTPNAGQPNYNCVASSSCNSPDMIENYMDYTYDACMNIFTLCQKSRMRAVLDLSPRRKDLLNSNVHLNPGSNPGAPIPRFSSNRTNICSGQSITFISQSTQNPSSTAWRFFDENNNVVGTFNGTNPIVNFTQQGIYSVELTVANAAGTNTLREENYITVLSSVSNTQLVDDLENASTALANWVLYNPDADRTFSFAPVSSFGIGARSVVFDNYSVEDDPSGTVDALVTPAINFTGISNPYLYFEHAYAPFSSVYADTLVLYYSIDCGATFTPFWFKGGVELATAPFTQDAFVPDADEWQGNQIHLGFLAGQPRVHFLFANFSGWGNYLYLDKFAFVNGANFSNGPPTPNLRTARRTICEGETILIEDISSNFPRQWLWEFIGGAPSTSQSQHNFVLYDTPGTYSITLNTSNVFGSNSGVAQNFISVVPLPDVSVVASQFPACGGSPVTLNAIGGNRYQWYDKRSGNLIFEGPTLTVTLFSDWEFLVVATNGVGCSRTTVFSLPVNAPAMPVISLIGQQLSASSGAIFQWYLNGSPIPAAQGGTSPSITPTASGTYLVRITDEAGCSNLSEPFVYQLHTAVIESIGSSRILRVFPNPANDILQLEVIHPAKGAFRLEIHNLLGKLMHRELIRKQDSQLFQSLDIGKLPPGIYTVTVQHEAWKGVAKLVKQ
jgi:PKD repeat protein